MSLPDTVILSLDVYPVVELLDHMVILFLIFFFGGGAKSLQMVIAAMKLKVACSLEEKL